MLQQEITTNEIKKIFGNTEIKTAYLKELIKRKNSGLNIARGKAKIDQQIIDTWEYNFSKDLLRELFANSEKYKYCSGCKSKIDAAIVEWNNLQLGSFQWPFSAMNFDQHVHTINRNNELSGEEKDCLLSLETIKFRRIKEINAIRNDYIEYLIFQNENVIPTFGNNRGVDFYIDGEAYDQKVAKSVGGAFLQTYGENYRTIAIAHPELVAKSLYENQDEERFGAEPRLLIVYLDSDIDSSSIENQLRAIDFTHPTDVEFDYIHSNNNRVHHRTKCFIVLLHH